jgi:hypothetical protein
MLNRDYENAGSEGDELDYALNSALAKYAAVEPRAGLEERVLANLRADHAHVPTRRWWHWPAAIAVAAIVVVAVALAWRSGKPVHPVVANHPTITSPAQNHVAPRIEQALNNSAPQPAPRVPRRRIANHVRIEAVVAEHPRLDKFPSPQPLTQQERALASYVSTFPREATLIAQRQEEFEKEIQQNMKDARSERGGSGYEQ